MEPISTNDIKNHSDIINTNDIYSGWWIPNDASVNSNDISIALSNEAKKNGVEIFEGIEVESITPINRNQIHIKTNNGNIITENLILCTGMWTRQICKSLNEYIPLHPCHHFYAITQPCNIDTNMPIIRDPDNHIYIKEWSNGLCFGGFEPNAKTCFNNYIPKNIPFHLFDEDWDQFEFLLEQSLNRVPMLENIPIRKLYNGPESFTPDMSCIVDNLKEYPNIYIAAGCNSSGIAMGGGIGKTITELITDKETEWDTSRLSLKRFSSEDISDDYLLNNITNSLSNHYK